MKARYVRVSTSNQKLERQLVKQHPNEQLFIDVISGATPFIKREKGKELLEAVKDKRVSYISVSSIDRLGRNLFDILSTLEVFEKNNAILKVDNLGVESMVKGKPNSAFKLIVSVMANIAEMERETLLERKERVLQSPKQKVLTRAE